MCNRKRARHVRSGRGFAAVMAGFLKSIFRGFRGNKEGDELDAGVENNPLHSPPVSGAFKTKKVVAVPASPANFVPLLAEAEGRLGGIQVAYTAFFCRLYHGDRCPHLEWQCITFVSLYSYQGLAWYWQTLRMDEEDDVAHEFLSEVRGSRFSRVLGRSLRAVHRTGEAIIEHGNVLQAVVAAGR